MKPWEKLFDIFSSVFSRDLSKEIPSPSSLSGAGIGQADSVGSSEYLEGGSTFNHSIELTDLNDFLEVGEHTDRKARYLEYDRMENIPEISSSLDTYADEITVPDVNGKIFDVKTPNNGIKKELEWLFNNMLHLDDGTLWSWARNICKNGDIFLEIIINSEHPEYGIQKIMELPPETMYRIETVRGRLIEFQQSYLGPDYQAVVNDIKSNNQENKQQTINIPTFAYMTTTGEFPTSNTIRFTPQQIIHMKIGNKRRGFYPYGISILYAGRRIAHLLKLMEDAMVIYRLTRSTERRIFYIDIGTLQPNKGEAVIERIKDKIKKKKIYNRHTGQIDERYNPWALDEDFFIPTRPESNTRVETLPGACLSLDTNIPLLDGRVLKLKDIIDEYNNRKQNWVYSCNPSNGDIVPGLISWAGITRKNTNVVKIIFDNNEELICTPDHKFPIIGKGKVQAKDLVIGESIIPFYTRKCSTGHKRDYIQVYNNYTKRWKFVHRLVAEYFKNTDLYNEFLFNEQYKENKKGLVHHKDYNRYNNNPDNLYWMNLQDHSDFHSTNYYSKDLKVKMHNGLKKYFKNLTKEQREIKRIISYKNILIGLNKYLHRLKSDKNYSEYCIERRKEGFKKSKILNPEKWEKRSKQLSELNKKRFSNPEFKKMIKEKVSLKFDYKLLKTVVDIFNKRYNITQVINSLNKNKEFINHFIELNKHIVRSNFKECVKSKGFTANHLNKMLIYFGYKNTKHFIKEHKYINHRIVKIEYLNEKMDTGTLTIDVNEKYHNFHTFAINNIGFVYNSNLDQIDDTKYFREKLMVALKLPKNYLFQEEVSITRTNFATQDMRFARAIYRVQKVLSYGLRQIAIRHLTLKGYPDSDIKDIKIDFTSPSDWLELSRAELLSSRYNLASSIKGSMIYDDFTILTKLLNHTDEEAREIIDRIEAQQLRMQEIQAQGQIFAQLATAEAQNPYAEPSQEPEQTPPENINPSDIIEKSPEEEKSTSVPEKEGSVKKPTRSKKKLKRYVDFSDLEADEEETDINYDL